MRVLVDTCVIIDALQSRVPFKEDAEKIFILAANREFDAFITAKAAADIYYLMHRITHDDKSARKILSDIFILFPPVDSAGEDCIYALSSEISDYEDAIMEETAKRCKIDCIITRNIRDYQKASVRVLSPDSFVTELEDKDKL